MEKTMERTTWGKVTEYMRMFNSINGYTTKGTKKHTYAVVVFTEDSFDRPFTEQERSYRFSNDNKAFIAGQIGNSIFGDCLDGKDNGVRLDWYMHDDVQPWKVDYCYLES